VETGLDRYVKFLKAEGLYAQAFSTVGTDVSDEICDLARAIYEKNPNAVFFGGQIVFPEEMAPTTVASTLPVARRCWRPPR
jgi:hypothetical protein